MAELFKGSWDIFQRRFSTLIGLFLLCMLAFTVPVGVAAGLAVVAGATLGKIGIAICGAAGMAASLYLGFRTFAGFLHAVVDERLALRDALEQGRGAAFALAWIGLLTGFIITGGFFLFIVPGIIFMVWFCFAQFILIEEQSHGMDAVLKSREYVRGEWFNVALRLLLVWALSILVGAIPMAGPILSLVFFPYVMIFHYLIYRDLRRMKGEVPYPCGLSDRAKWPAVALIGYVVVPVALVSLVGVSALGHLKKLGSGEGLTISGSASGTPAGPGPGADSARPGDGVLRVITFPGKEAGGQPATGAEGAPPSPAAAPDPAGSQPSPAAADERPGDLHVFIYAANYSGRILANGGLLQELGGKPDMQYNYNQSGREQLRYGQNRIEVEYAEVPAHAEGLLRVKIKISRKNDILAEWSFEDKGSGTKSFTFDIPKPN